MIKGIYRMIKGMFIKIKDAILDLPKNQLPNLEFLLPTFMALTAFISGLVGYIKFVIKGGYKQAADKQLSGGGLFKNMTTGIREKIFIGTVDKILIGLLILEFIVIMIYYFKTSGKGKRIVMIVDSVILGIQTLLTVFLFNGVLIEFLATLKSEISWELYDKIKDIPIDPFLIVKIYLTITLGAILCFLILIFITKDCRRVILKASIGIGLTQIAIPILFWMLYNVVQLAFGILAIGFILGAIYVLLSAGGSNEGRYKVYDSETGKDIGEVDFRRKE